MRDYGVTEKLRQYIKQIFLRRVMGCSGGPLVRNQKAPYPQGGSSSLMWPRCSRKALKTVVKQKKALTPDLGGNASTTKVGDAIVKEVDQVRGDMS